MKIRRSILEGYLREILDGGIDVQSKASGAGPSSGKTFHHGNTAVNNDPAVIWDVPLDKKPVVPVSAELETGGLVVEPPVGDPDFIPINTTELGHSLSVLAKTIAQGDIEKVYDEFKEYLMSLKDDGDKMKDRMIKVEGFDSRKQLREHIRKLLETTPMGSLLNKVFTQSSDPDVIPGEEQDLGTIAQAVGAKSSGGIGGTEQRAIKKLRFLMKKMQPADLEDMLFQAQDDYISYLVSSKELSPEEIEFLGKHPDVVGELDGFREFFAKYIKRAAKDRGVDVQWAPTKKPRGKHAHPSKLRKPIDAEPEEAGDDHVMDMD